MRPASSGDARWHRGQAVDVNRFGFGSPDDPTRHRTGSYHWTDPGNY